MGKHIVASVADFGPGSHRLIDVNGRSIGVYNLDGQFYALRNVCPHHGAPLCLGEVTGQMAPSQPHTYEYVDAKTVLRCPWHGYEFRIADGRSFLRPDTLRVRAYQVEVEGDDVVLHV
jgi:nitrite reductase (NADH) small subunit